MCLAKVYLKDELLAESIASVEIRDGKVLLKTIFGEEKEVEANIRKINFANSSINLESRVAIS